LIGGSMGVTPSEPPINPLSTPSIPKTNAGKIEKVNECFESMYFV